LIEHGVTMTNAIETVSEHTCNGGTQGFYRHASRATGTTMAFAVFVPPQAARGPVPALYFLAGLTCTEETATIKAGAQHHAARHGLALVMPDTSPRGAGIDGEDDDWDFGTGAGFYLDATADPWARSYRMESYVVDELRALVNRSFPVRPEATGIFGHSMGGHGALTLAFKHPDVYRSVSAFAPICAPASCPWGTKAFSGYLGADRESWKAHDATELVRSGRRQTTILIDQGDRDQFLEEQLLPREFEAVCREGGQELELRLQSGYDHSYYFIQTFMGDHLEHHAELLTARR
jgi:S-formylglutathione hydrolase